MLLFSYKMFEQSVNCCGLARVEKFFLLKTHKVVIKIDEFVHHFPTLCNMSNSKARVKNLCAIGFRWSVPCVCIFPVTARPVTGRIGHCPKWSPHGWSPTVMVIARVVICQNGH